MEIMYLCEQKTGFADEWAFLIIWDNFNIAFCVSEQCKVLKDHFDNRTTTTVIPLYGVEFGSLLLDLKPLSVHHIPQ